MIQKTEDKTNYKALIYCRVSSPRQVLEGHGNDSQEQLCRNRAKVEGWLVEKVFPDDGISGALFDRPAMKQLIAYIDTRPKEKFVVIFDDLARFARDILVHINLKTEFLDRGIKLECLNFNFEDSPEGEFAEMVMACANQLQRKQNRRQVIDKMRARLERGYWPFYPPLGLTNKKDDIHGKLLVPNEPYASIFKEAIEQFRDCVLLTMDEVMVFIQKKYLQYGIQRKLVLNGVKFILSQPLYAGWVGYEPWGVPLKKGQHEGFISKETYDAVQARFSGRPKPKLRADYNLDFPLRGLISCAECGGPITGAYNTGRSKRYPNYSCHAYGCSYRWKVTSKWKIEPEFVGLLEKVKVDDGVVDLGLDILTDTWRQHKEHFQLEVAQAHETAKQLIGEVERLNERVRKTDNAALVANYETQLAELLARKEKLEAAPQADVYTEQQFGTASKKVFDTLKDPVSMWQSPNYEDKRTIAYMYFDQKIPYDYQKGFGTACLAYPVEVIKSFSDPKNNLVEMEGVSPRMVKVILGVYKRTPPKNSK